MNLIRILRPWVVGVSLATSLGFGAGALAADQQPTRVSLTSGPSALVAGKLRVTHGEIAVLRRAAELHVGISALTGNEAVMPSIAVADSDYVTVAQLKTVVAPLYDALTEPSAITIYPWQTKPWPDDTSFASAALVEEAFAPIWSDSSVAIGGESAEKPGATAESKGSVAAAASESSNSSTGKDGANAKATSPSTASGASPAKSTAAPAKISIDYPAPGEKL